MRKFIPVISLGLVTVMAFSACESSGDNALAGAAVGAAIGGLIHGSGRDAVRGAAIGAGAGYLIGKLVRHERRERERRYYEDRYYGPEEAEYERSGKYPTARMTDRYGYVISPYPPHNTIYIRGIPPGAKVIDPSCNRIFITP